MNRIKELRILLGLTQYELAYKLGLNQTAVGKYERGQLEPSIDTLKKLSSIFECSVDYLIGHSDDFGSITVYEQTDTVNSLSADEQKIIDLFRKKKPMNFTDMVSMYADLPRYLQENIFAELKGMHLANQVSKVDNPVKNKSTKEI